VGWIDRLTGIRVDLRGRALKVASIVGGIVGLEVDVEGPARVPLHRVGQEAVVAILHGEAIHLALRGQRPTHPIQRPLQHGIRQIGLRHAPHGGRGQTPAAQGMRSGRPAGRTN